MVDSEDCVKWIVYRCRELGKPVTEALAVYVAHTVYNSASKKFFLEDGLKTEQEATSLVNLAVEKLTRENDPSMETLRMQIAYDASYIQQEYLQQHYSSVQTQETNNLIDDIINCDTRSGNDFEGITQLYKKIFSFLMFRNKQINQTYANAIIRPGGGMNSLSALNNAVMYPNIQSQVISSMEREVAAALESVLPRPGLRPFIAMSSAEKVSQLIELSNIIIGIRLFNKEIGRGGAGLESFDTLVSYTNKGLLYNVNQEVLQTAELCEDYAAVLERVHMNPVHGQTWKQELIHRRQYLSYLLALQEDLQNAEALIENLHGRYLRELVDLKELIGNKASIPKDQVYPKFDTIAQIYAQMNDEKNKAILREELFNLLQEHKKRVDSSLTMDQREMPGDDMLAADESLIDVRGAEGVIRLTSESNPDFMHIPLDYQGFCIWTLTQKNGVLIPGKPALGVIRYNDRNFVLASPRAVKEFMANPQKYLKKAVRIARSYPELIHLLRLTDEFPKSSLTNLLQGKEGSPLFSVTAPLMVDQGMETPLHFVEEFKDPNYHWNEWELRRKALQMADIRTKQTTGIQTSLSNFKRDSETQVWLPKEQESQTGKQTATKMEQTLTYIVGLRDARIK